MPVDPNIAHQVAQAGVDTTVLYIFISVVGVFIVAFMVLLKSALNNNKESQKINREGFDKVNNSIGLLNEKITVFTTSQVQCYEHISKNTAEIYRQLDNVFAKIG